MNLYKSFIVICVLLFFISVAIADTFENHAYTFWANTPMGKFECSEDKTEDGMYVLKMAGKIIYKGRFDERIQSGLLKDGIINENVGCPWVIASYQGYIIIKRDVQPPHYGIQGYAVIDFNDSEFLITELAEGQRAQDDKVSAKNRIKWDSKGFMLTYFGYPIDKQGGSKDSPKPRMHVVRYDFKSSNVIQIR